MTVSGGIKVFPFNIETVLKNYGKWILKKYVGTLQVSCQLSQNAWFKELSNNVCK